MSRKSEKETDFIESSSPSKEDLFFTEWGKETLKENISVLNETFKLFISLDTVLLSAYVSFYDSVLVNALPFSWQTIAPAFCVMLSLSSSIIGIYPFSIKVNLAAPDKIKEYKEKRSNFKRVCLAIAAIALISGFVVFLLAKMSLPFYVQSQLTSPPTSLP